MNSEVFYVVPARRVDLKKCNSKKSQNTVPLHLLKYKSA
jgi:hypothetical protein